VLVLAFCGLRWGEAIALRVADVDFLRRRIMLSANAVQLGGKHHVGPTKDRRSRSVPVPEFVVEDLCRLCEGKSRDDLIFPTSNGGYLPRPRSGDGWFAAALRRAEVPTITVHDLRHTCASLAVCAGVNVLALQRMLGHGSLFDADLDDVAVQLHTACAPNNVGTSWALGA
jgi:integrase